MDSKHIHIVGCLPRSGTTLMTELMITCFDIDGYTDHEYSIFKEYPFKYQILCTKKPNDIKRVAYPLMVNPSLFVIYMLRDPRDTIASRSHKNNQSGKKIWGNLHDWLLHQEFANALADNTRFITVKYEDLVSNPDAVQQQLLSLLPFIRVKAKFSEYHLVANPSKKSEDALGGARPISASSIGNWKNNKPYLKAQLDKYGDISQILIALGYEKDEHWLSELSGVIADNSEEPIKGNSKIRLWWGKHITQPRRRLLYRLSCSKSGRFIGKLRYFLRTGSLKYKN